MVEKCTGNYEGSVDTYLIHSAQSAIKFTESNRDGWSSVERKISESIRNMAEVGFNRSVVTIGLKHLPDFYNRLSELGYELSISDVGINCVDLQIKWGDDYA